jgi:hypothetical protein
MEAVVTVAVVMMACAVVILWLFVIALVFNVLKVAFAGKLKHVLFIAPHCNGTVKFRVPTVNALKDATVGNI